MADSICVPGAGAAVPAAASPPRRSATVRVTHWIAALCFLALLVTGAEIVISHPRFYWGEEGNVLMPALFELPIPASRGSVKTGYSFVLRDQNGWSRYLHFQSGWLLVFAGLLYAVHGLRTRHFRNELVPTWGEVSWRSLTGVLRNHLRPSDAISAESWRYNVLQRLTYLAVVFVLFPAMIWTGLAMSPAVTGAFPFLADLLGGFQSARTIHFVVTLSLVLFLLVHVGMVWRAGFRTRVGAMITGRTAASEEHT